MRQKSNVVVFIGMSYPWGGIRHFALLGAEIAKLNSTEFDFYFASITKAPNEGFWQIVKNDISEERIIEEESFEELVARMVGLASVYDKVLIHAGGGWGQTKHLVRAIHRLDRALRRRILLVGTTHSYKNDSWMRIPMSAFQYVLYRFFYRMIVFQCQYAADKFVGGNDLIRRGRGVVIPLGCEPFPQMSSTIPPAIQKMGLGDILLNRDVFKFVYLAAFRPGKMHAWLVRAIAPVLHSHNNAKVILCGQIQDRGAYLEAKGAISREGLQGSILLPGMVPRKDVPWLLQHVNCAIVPSRAETFGHNFLEPMFAGIPVIGTSVGIGRDVITDNKTGWGFALKDPSTLTQAALRMVEHPDDAARMGQMAKKEVENRFRHSDVARQLTDLYKQLLG